MAQKTVTPDFRQVLTRIGEQASSTGRVPLKYFGKLADFLAGINLSIRTKILASLCVVILLMGATNIVSMLQVLRYSRQYDAIITNITTANSISGRVKPDIDNEMWRIVSGKVEFSSGKQYEIIDTVDTKVRWMMDNTDSQRAKVKLDLVLRTLQSLKADLDLMGDKIAHNSTAAENEAVLEKIRFSTSVLDESIQNYVLYEVNRTEGQYQVMRESFARWQVFSIILIFSAVGFAIVAAWSLSKSIYTPIKKLHDVTTTITKNDLQTLMTSDNVDEITELGMSFNIMIGKIKELLDSKIKEQENLKKAELRALQAQINPHFLYNTLDTIIWMAESKKTDQVVKIVTALSKFFRISLSKGMDWITIGEEVERIKSYLTIQKMRYRDILDFKIDVDKDVAENTILKLILQPLVENALYHGIKNKRRGGTISVRARRKDENEILLEVEDDGIGFTPEKLARLRNELNDDSGEIKMESGYGIGNVNNRIRLYYGKQYGLSIQSEYGTGTRITLVIPSKMETATQDMNSL
ncbi:MAG: sensor histidine kinase [Anaerolineales bacterium]|nr:sensor histidine kinase [Anaerolineales bacterium]